MMVMVVSGTVDSKSWNMEVVALGLEVGHVPISGFRRAKIHFTTS